MVHMAYDHKGDRMAVKKLRSLWQEYPLETIYELTCLSLQHPHLASMHGVCRPSYTEEEEEEESDTDGSPRAAAPLWLCMPHGGDSLDAWLRAHRPSAAQAWRFMAQLLCGIDFLHNVLRVYHGDVKPANVLVDPRTQQLRICDFGAAGCVDRLDGQRAEYKFTRWYRPPEVEYRRGVHALSDMWSLGCIGMEMLLAAQARSQYHVLFQGRWSGFTPASSSSFSADSQMHVTLQGLLWLHMDVRNISLYEAEKIVRKQLEAYMDDKEEDLPPPPVLRIRDDGTEEGMAPVSARATWRRMDAELRAAAAAPPPPRRVPAEHQGDAQLFLDMLHLHPAGRPSAAAARARLKMSIVSTDTDDDHAHVCAGAVRLLMARLLARAKADVKEKLDDAKGKQRELQAALALPFHPDADAAERRLAWCLRFAATPFDTHLSDRLGGFDTRLFPTRDTPHAAVVRAWFQLLRALPYDDICDAIDQMADHFDVPVPLAQPPAPRGCRPRT